MESLATSFRSRSGIDLALPRRVLLAEAERDRSSWARMSSRVTLAFENGASDELRISTNFDPAIVVAVVCRMKIVCPKFGKDEKLSDCLSFCQAQIEETGEIQKVEEDDMFS